MKAMSLLNYFLNINAYSDPKASNSPNLTNVRWARSIQGIPAEDVNSLSFSIAPSSTRIVIDSGEAKFLYVEASSALVMSLNGQIIEIKPIVVGTSVYPGQFLIRADIVDLSFENNEDSEADVFLIHHN